VFLLGSHKDGPTGRHGSLMGWDWRLYPLHPSCCQRRSDGRVAGAVNPTHSGEAARIRWSGAREVKYLRTLSGSGCRRLDPCRPDVPWDCGLGMGLVRRSTRAAINTATAADHQQCFRASVGRLSIRHHHLVFPITTIGRVYPCSQSSVGPRLSPVGAGVARTHGSSRTTMASLRRLPACRQSGCRSPGRPPFRS